MTHAERLIYLVLEPGFKNENQRGVGVKEKILLHEGGVTVDFLIF